MPPGEQLDLESAGLRGVPRRLFACTPTRLTTWSDCPRRYRFGYVDRPPPPKGPPWAHNAFGSTVHNALRGWYDLPTAARSPGVAAALVDGAWVADGYRDDAQEQAARDRARSIVREYLRSLAPAGDPRGVERTVAFRTERMAVSGRVDRIDERPSPAGDGPAELVVVDYKTGRQAPGVDDVRGSLALALYAVGAQRTLRAACTRVELHHVPSGTVVGWDHTPATLERAVRRAQAIADEAQAADEQYVAALAGLAGPAQVSEPAAPANVVGGAAVAQVADRLYPPRPGSLCGWCDYRQHCPEGLAASRPRAPWDALAVELGPTGVPGGAAVTRACDDGDATQAP